MSRGADERTQMNSMENLLATCESTSNRERVDQVLAWTTQGTEQQQRERAAGVKKHLHSMLAATTSGRGETGCG